MPCFRAHVRFRALPWLTAALLAAIKEEIISKGLIRARGVYQTFPVNSEGDSIYFYGPGGERLADFAFPRQAAGDRLCLADFASPASEVPFGLSPVTM